MTKSKGILIRDPLVRFRTNVIIPATLNACWEWVGIKSIKGYGTMKVKGKKVQAHRFSYELYIGIIPPNMCVCHHCDNPGCVNPLHLFLGTATDNNLDRNIKGRQATGEKHGSSKLKLKEVNDIKFLLTQGVSDSFIARTFGVWHTTIRAIRLGRTWR